MAVKYKYPENVKVADFVRVKLSGTNYFVWKSMMLSLIESHGLMDFISKDRQASDEEDLEEMNKIDKLVRRWILETVNDNIFVNIIQLKTSEAIWGLLTRYYSPRISPGDQAPEHTVDYAHKSDIVIGYLPLAKAAMNNDWKKGAEFINQQPDSIRANITGYAETALSIAARSVLRIEFLRELVAIMSPEDVALGNKYGFTALHMAAVTGNMEAAKLILDKNEQLLFSFGHSRLMPLHVAATGGHKEMVVYLLNLFTSGDAPYDNEAAGQLLVLLISSEFYDVALDFVKRYPKSATSKYGPLTVLTRKCSAFPSGSNFNFWQRIIYSGVAVKLEDDENLQSRNSDKENSSTNFISVRHKLCQLFWKAAERSAVPQIKGIRDKKLIHYQAQQLSKILVGEIVKLNYAEVAQLFGMPFLEGAVLGVNEVVEEILKMYPGAIYLTNASRQTIFHIAVVNRRERVFNIIYQLEERVRTFLAIPDASLNNTLHLAGRLDNDQKIKLRASAAGAALQMQRELQWFMEVERLTGGYSAKNINFDGKTAPEIFSETHQELVKEGEEWMKGTSNSCAIVAALIVTIVFAAAITVPGGNDSNTGLPFFAKHNKFMVFAISDVLALFSSTSSLLMFLSILTSRYSEGDFLYALPKRLIIGLTTLFLSIIFMMIAFTAAVEVLFGEINSWILGSVIALACIPVTLFMSLQFSLLVDMIKSTYGSGIFGKQSDRIIH